MPEPSQNQTTLNSNATSKTTGTPKWIYIGLGCLGCAGLIFIVLLIIFFVAI